jgi:hypothetical protein
MRNPFAPRPAATDTADASPVVRIADRARAAHDRESAHGRRTAKRSGEAARAAAAAQIDDNRAGLEAALAAVEGFSEHTQRLLADELDAADPVTQYSPLGLSSVADAGLPGWLRDRVVRDGSPRADAEAVVLDWLVFGGLFVAHREFSARPADDPLPQLYEALSLSTGESIAVEGVAAAGAGTCTRILHVALALRDAQRASADRARGSLSGYAAADAQRAFDRSHRSTPRVRR